MCGSFERRLSDYLNGALPPQEHVELEKHLSSCDACRRKADTMRRTVFLLQGLEQHRTSPDFKAALYRKLSSVQEPSPKSFWQIFPSLRARWLWRPVAAVAILVLLAVGLWKGRSHSPASAPDNEYVRLCLEDHAAFAADHPLADRSALLLGISGDKPAGLAD